MSFTIKVVATGAFSPSQKAIISTAAARCKKMVVSAPLGMSQVFIEVKPGTLGPGQNAQSKIVLPWPGIHLPERAELLLSKTELAALENDGRLADIVLHELLHCLGFGLVWNKLGKVKKIGGELLFVGGKALEEYKELLAAAGKDSTVSGVPVEDDGIIGQNSVHWREIVFGNELMSTAQPTPGNPLSRLSLASLADLGYGVDYDYAEPYQL